ncbi:hypothetical protein M758_9G007900 [Ceratodon purpureus]|nr:hypothetical protein M758_9G007900 [Ceratodon purpureus]
MVQPRLSVGTSKYWLRARSGNRNGGKILVSVDSLYSIFKENRVRSTPKKAEVPAAVIPATTTSSRNAPGTSPALPTIRKSARLFEKRAALLRCTRGPQYWLRTRSRGNKRSLLVSVKSLYASEAREHNVKEDHDKNTKTCSGCCQQTPQRRKSARLFEKRAASLLSCRTGRPGGVHRKMSKFKRKKKHICWLYKGTPWLGGCYNSKFSAHIRSKGLRVNCDSGNKDRGADIASPCSGKRFHDPACRPVLQRLTERGEEDLLQSILEKLPPADLLQAARVCRSWARLCEPAFREECHRKGWSLPRLPRGATPAFPWRSLYHRHACRACGKVGEFFVRKTLNGNFQFLLCGGCIRLPDVRNRLVQYSIDLYGVTGKLLAPNVSSRGAC